MIWDLTKFKDCFDFEKKSKVKAGDGLSKGKYPFFTSSTELTKFIDNYLFDKPSLIFGTGGKANVHYSDNYFSVSTDCLVASVKKNIELNTKFVFYYLFGNINILEKGFKGAGLKHISKDYINEIVIPIPSIATQKKIVEILDTAEALKRKDQELLKKYDELAQSIFIDMFGDPVRNEKGWETKTIEEITQKKKYSIKRGPFGGALKKEVFVDEGYLVYEQYHALNNDYTFGRYFIDEKKYNELAAFDVQPRDIIISCSGVYLGKLSIVPKGAKPGIINQALLKITLDESIYKNEFFVKVFRQENFKDKYFASERGAAIPNFPPMSVFKEFKFICPPIELQNRYIEIVNSLESQMKVIKNSKNSLEDLFQNLLQKAFKGELIA